jgi:hypothetical protein
MIVRRALKASSRGLDAIPFGRPAFTAYLLNGRMLEYAQ